MDGLLRGVMSASLVERIPVEEQLQSLMTVVQQLQQEVGELRCDVGYWKSLHARAVDRNTKLQGELDQAQAEIRQFKAERFGKQSEKRSASDRSNQLDDPQEQATPKKKRGQQPGRSAPNPATPRRESKIGACCNKALRIQSSTS